MVTIYEQEIAVSEETKLVSTFQPLELSEGTSLVRAWRLAGLSTALAFPLDLGARPLCRRLRVPRETGLILRCAGKAGNPFQTTQGNRLSCRDQEGQLLAFSPGKEQAA